MARRERDSKGHFVSTKAKDAVPAPEGESLHGRALPAPEPVGELHGRVVGKDAPAWRDTGSGTDG